MIIDRKGMAWGSCCLLEYDSHEVAWSRCLHAFLGWDPLRPFRDHPAWEVSLSSRAIAQSEISVDFSATQAR